MLRFIFTYLLVLLCSVAYSQQNVSGLADNPEYLNLTSQSKSLQVKSDSIKTLIENNRTSFAKDKNRKYSDEIVRLEMVLLDINARIINVNNSIDNLEHDYMLKNISSDGQTDAKITAPQYKKLYDHPYFKDNLSVKEYKNLNEYHSKLKTASRLQKEFLSLYSQIKDIETSYQNVSEQVEADLLFDKYAVLAAEVDSIDSQMREVWSTEYDTVAYLQILLLDRLNSTSDLEILNEELSDLRMVQGESLNLQAPYVSFYPFQHKLLTLGESMLARKLGMTKMADSLKKESDKVKINEWRTLKVDLQPKDFYNYENIKIQARPYYSSSNPVGENVAPSRGVVFKLQMAASTSATVPYTAFKGVYPIYKEKFSDGYIRYFAGGFKTLKDAEEALARVKKLSLKPFIVWWLDGKFKGMYRSREYVPSSAKKNTDSDMLYSIKITAKNNSLPQKAKDLIDILAPGKEITRVEVDGLYMFSVGSFDDEILADQLVVNLKDISGLSVELIKLQ